ncbi:hypothetical protein [Streptomyces sp. NPDC054854]
MPRHGRPAPTGPDHVPPADLHVQRHPVDERHGPTVLAPGVGPGKVGAPPTGLTLSRIDDAHTGSASDLFNTASHLGIELGVVATEVVLPHEHTAAARGTDAVAASTATLLHVIGGGLPTMGP